MAAFLARVIADLLEGDPEMIGRLRAHYTT
jgi:hypothetical protein